jgi:threonyl-tRNA synthetase
VPVITLPDGSKRKYNSSITPLNIAEDISNSLKKSSSIAKVDGEFWDLDREITKDANVSLIKKGDIEALGVLRHDCAHILAESVLELFPETQVTIGPVIENGFYYDFYRKIPFSSDDLIAIEKRMHKIVDRNEVITREIWSRSDATKFYKEKNEPFKVELIEDIPNDQTLTFYRQGNFIDLCRGPHLRTTLDTGHAFKLMSVAGAYWRGDSNKPMLQRIYGTAWNNEKDLNNYLLMIEEAEKRDHRKLGKAQKLFHIQEEATGSIFWHPLGWTIYQEIEAYIRRRLKSENYYEIKTPQLIDRSLWESSGHWEKFGEHMFTADTDENQTLALKPMNCPGHVQVFKQGLKSYRDLPLRFSEFGACHRKEPSGALHGIMRVRAFTQDDAHIFCTEEQINKESISFCELLRSIYNDFGFEKITIKFSDRPAVRAGEDATWDQAEKALMEASNAAGLDTILNPGEGAFYGPKLEFVLRDAIGRDWQCGTLQVDFVLPERLNAEYIATDGSKKRPVMLHRAILGSMERWIGILIEQYAGKWPLWIAPIQIVVCTITQEADIYSEEIKKQAEQMGLRVLLDKRNEKIGYKIREHSENKIPILFIVGKKELLEQEVSIRCFGSKDQFNLSLQEALVKYKEEALPPDLARAN